MTAPALTPPALTPPAASGAGLVPVRLLFVLGASTLSAAIGLLGTEECRYSHVAIVCDDGSLIEARELHQGAGGRFTDGVLHERTLAAALAERPRRADVATFRVDAAAADAAFAWLRTQLGRPYDYATDLALARRVPLAMPASGDPPAWMCSGLAFAFLRRCGLPVLGRTTPRSCDPSRLALAPAAAWAPAATLLPAPPASPDGPA